MKEGHPEDRPKSWPLRRQFNSMTNAVMGIADLIGAEEGLDGTIIGTGMSLEGFDFAEIEAEGGGPMIGMNEATKIVVPDYLVMSDAQAVGKALPFLEPGHTVVVIAKRCFEYASSRANLLADLGRAKEVRIANFTAHEGDPTETIFFTRGILTGALSLACALGWKSAHLYGCDYYRTIGQLYAHDISPARPENLYPHPNEEDHPNLFLTPAFHSMRQAIEENLEAWKGLDVINMSRYSTLGCFPIGEGALPKE